MIQARSNEPRTKKLCQTEHEWAVIMAGGDGNRLKSLTRRITGDERPKQFCSVLGGATLLEETRRRTALALAKERTLFVVNQLHRRYYEPLLADTYAPNVIPQPRNVGTAPAILYSLLRVRVTDPNAVVAFFPSDHYVSDNGKFMSEVRTALDAAHANREIVVLLGLEPESPEVEYGWIEPTKSTLHRESLFGVRRFWEKPNQFLAEALLARGCLWNSFVMVASAAALLTIVEATLPELYRSFAYLSSLLQTQREAKAIAELYSRLSESNFSHQVLAQVPHQLAVLKVSGVRWNDLGEPKRVLASLSMAGIFPSWLEAAAPQFA